MQRGRFPENMGLVEDASGRSCTCGQLRFDLDFRMAFDSPLLRPTSQHMKYSEIPRQYLISVNSYILLIEITVPHPGPLCKAGPRNLWEGSGVIWRAPLFMPFPLPRCSGFSDRPSASQHPWANWDCVPWDLYVPPRQESTQLSCGIHFNYHALSTGLHKEFNEMNTFQSLYSWISRFNGGENLEVGTGFEEEEEGTE